MEQNQNNSPKVDVTKESYLELLNYASQLKMEERNEAMDMYRKAADEMEDGEMIAYIGKTAISFLDLASKTSSSIIDIAQSIQKIAFNEQDDEDSGGISISSEEREVFAEMAKEMRDSRRSRKNRKENNEDTE